ncbi:hypothetical protein PTSG_08977 [Salpingoeca rosetta]|uniref:Uncharacterized protein n=1 Tax=Salpingoeca rosetta (strain ATCC 50818 / BSB-021) TaxID=946362 RepID=F2ULV0_SALR5|nr:uncharacterized protein PTSG_08977 [Salpingoeca rosetta]EGD78099.1 hypothetical protein PTSG_08977 [Salpingoeca rosetta]|eukprot:XP_004989775.1 hypothetical protein PTSG_08977 [Salpingoeca rosetta]
MKLCSVFAVAVVAAMVAVFAAPSSGYYTANVFFVNLLNETLSFGGCSGTNGTLPVTPQSIIPGQATRIFINTTEKMEDVSGICWWSMRSKVACDPNPPPSPATSCPFITWQRTIVVGQEDIDWEIETPGHYGIGDVTLTKRIGHQSKQYCICMPTESDCQSVCKEN